jgi:quercetin dioxygenase-like cupin family protein
MTRYLPCTLAIAVCALGASTIAIENDQVKVIKAYEEPFVQTPLHQHTSNRVIIFEQAGSQDIVESKAKPHTLSFKAGQVIWSPSGGMHMSRIITATPVPIVEIELKQYARPQLWTPGDLDPVKVDPKHYTVEFENTQVRVLRVKIGPHESTPLHTHSVNRVVTYLTGQDFRITTEDGKTESSKHSPGDVTWSGPATHKEENLSDTPFEVVVAEIKN